MAKVYLETSFFSSCVLDRKDAKSVARQEDSRRWWVQQRHHHDLYLSPEVVRELSDPTFRHSSAALALAGTVASLAITPEVLALAKILVREHVMPGPIEKGDAIHVAAATVNSIEYLLSWNVKHLANLNKVKHLREVCRRAAYVPPTITTPDLLWS